MNIKNEETMELIEVEADKRASFLLKRRNGKTLKIQSNRAGIVEIDGIIEKTESPKPGFWRFFVEKGALLVVVRPVCGWRSNMVIRSSK